jgi:hypothetical protein
MPKVHIMPTDPEFSEQRSKHQRFRLSRRNRFVLTLLFGVFGIWFALRSLGDPRVWIIDCDRERYFQIRKALDADPDHLYDKTLDEIIKKLALENVPWDDVPTNNDDPCRIYHFRGFALYVTLESLPAGLTRDMRKGRGLNEEEIHRPKVWWIAGDRPFILLDGIRDREQRMKNYRDSERKMLEEINAGMRKRSRG